MGQVFGGEVRLDMVRQLPGVAGGHRENDLVSGVGVDRRRHPRTQLVEVLVGQHQRHMQPPELGERVIEPDRQIEQVVTLVQDHASVEPVRLGQVGACLRGVQQRGEQQRADQPHRVITQCGW